MRQARRESSGKSKEVSSLEPLAGTESHSITIGSSYMTSVSTIKTFRYCGRDFTLQEMDWIRKLIASHPEVNRSALSYRSMQRNGNGNTRPKITSRSDQGVEISLPAGELVKTERASLLH